jgi:hypothetical protein
MLLLLLQLLGKRIQASTCHCRLLFNLADITLLQHRQQMTIN